MSESKTNQCDYTLPPLPEPDSWDAQMRRECLSVGYVEEYGKACAEAARAPLLARLARPAHAHLVGDHINGLVDGCILCDSIKERDAMRARIAELEAQLAQHKENAKRYRFLETRARAHSLRMDGTSEWSIGPIGSRGRTLSEAIDAVRIIVPMKEDGDA